jgi:hypothetical protein
MARDALYVKDPVVIAYKSPNQKKAKIKVLKGRNVDQLLDCNFEIPGIRNDDIILAVGLGSVLKHHINLNTIYPKFITRGYQII